MGSFTICPMPDPVYNHPVTANLRTLLICLLMLALPVQGWAAAGMLYCGSQGGAGHADAGAHSHELVPDGAQHLHEPTHHAHEHGHLHASPAADANPATHHPHDSPASHATDVHAASTGLDGDASIAISCTVCAACCGATAVISPAILPPATTVSRVKMQDRMALHFDFLTDGPRRPPRS